MTQLSFRIADSFDVETLQFRLLAVLRRGLLTTIDQRLAELEQEDHAHCLVCRYPLTLGAEDICLCCAGICPCKGQWPPYNEFFRCEVQARLAWLGFEAARYQRLPDAQRQRLGEFKPAPFPAGRPAVPAPPMGQGNIFQRLRQVDLAQYCSHFTSLSQVQPDRWKGKCPLHDEKTPSFYVYQGEGGWRWHCFGACATGGDIIDLKRELRRVGKG